jgi:hypothetical protein
MILPSFFTSLPLLRISAKRQCCFLCENDTIITRKKGRRYDKKYLLSFSSGYISWRQLICLY